MQMIRYHPLIDGDTDGLEKVPMFLSTDKETVRQNSRMYLSEIISNYYRLYSKEPMSQNATDSIEIHCPLWNSIPYGQALPKQKYRITDENFVECGVDIPGELQIGGGSLAKGYINDEELTMKKFITDVKGERWYRTGDRGRRWADGTIEFLGRMDTQVKIRGHRIELGEIESVLKSISRIKEAVVVAQVDKYHKELVGLYIMKLMK